MSRSPTPRQLFVYHYRRFAATIDGVRDGNADAVHDARVAVRRMRATLPLMAVSSSRKSGQHWAPALRDIGRALGRVRDLDVSIELLREFERRAPSIACLVVSMRQSLAAQQVPARRRMIKRLESSRVETVLRELDDFARSSVRRFPLRRFRLRRPPTDPIRRHVARHARSLARTIERAGGAYFPRRVHSARVDAKKLRYAIEIAAAAGVWRGEAALSTLRWTQEVLGRLHDRQVLLDLLDEPSDAAGAMASQREMFARILEAERDDLHQRYVGNRPDLLALCAAGERLAGPAARGVGARDSWLACGAVAVPAALWLLRRRRPAETAAEPAPEAADWRQVSSMGAARDYGRSHGKATVGELA